MEHVNTKDFSFICHYCENIFPANQCCPGDDQGRAVEACETCAEFHCDSFILSARQIEKRESELFD